ncbi:MAG: tetratricopeptide repeat protein [Opitutaceae bacterium]|jgi:tetratricopeptide (TPR) repeat protein
MDVLPHRWLKSGLLVLLLASRLAAASDFDHAVALFQAKHYPEAGAAFGQLSAREPRNYAVHYYLGRIALERDDAAAGIDELEKAVAAQPNNSDYVFWLGGAYGLYARQTHSLFKAHKCRNTLLRAIELDPGNLDARAALVDFYRQAPFLAGGSLTKARAQAREIKKLDPLRGAVAEGEICINERKYDDAFAIFEDLLKGHPDQITALYQIGFIAATTGRRLDRGEAALKAYLTHSPSDLEPSLAYAHYRLGDIYRQKNEADAARQEYQAALALDPNLKPAAKALDRLK